MKKCPKCGKQYDDSWNVCLSCNSSLGDENVEAGDELEKKANAKRKKAESLKVPDNVYQFYETVKYKDDIFNPPSDEYSNFQRVSSIEVDKEKCSGIQFLVKGVKYMLVYRTGTCHMPVGDDYYESEYIYLFVNDKKVFSFSPGRYVDAHDDSEYSSWREENKFTWETKDINSFIEGDWVKELKPLLNHVEKYQKQQQQKNQEEWNNLKTKKLKDDFGLE
jgi:hypothetical protein